MKSAHKHIKFYESLNRYLVIKTCLQLRTQEDLKYSRGRVHLLSLDSESLPVSF